MHLQAGSRAVLVFVHGLSGSSRWWRPVLPLLGGRPATLVDVPHFGRALAADRAAEWLAARLDPGTVLVGHSLGGLIAALVTAARPELVRALVLVDPAGAPAPRSLGAYGAGLVRTLATAPPHLVRTVAADAVRTGPLALARGALFATRTRFAGEIAAPTLLVWGERDALVPVELAAEWRRCLPQARLVTIPGAGHVPMLERPSAFADALLEFLDDVDDRRRV
jgi:pimeloyl-ACP methyl ester carboxylesterase